MIPTVNLDDRTFDDIRDEAIRLIPRYCPEWTNHNASDPGITLIELFSWMTEMMLYRLNKVPQKNYLAMLELMGLSLTAPQSARAIVRFYPVENCNKNILIKRGTKIASVSDDTRPIIFETERNLIVRDTKLVSCINRTKEQISENCTEAAGVQKFTLFETQNSISHMLYISSPVFKYLREGHAVALAFESSCDIVSVQDEIINHVYFEYWDGRLWTEIKSFASINGIKRRDNVTYLKGPAAIESCEIHNREGFFIRAVLSDIPENKNTLVIKNIRVQSIFEGAGFIPDVCIRNANGTYEVVDMNNTFRLFSEIPSFNEVFYIGADEILKNKNSKVTITFMFSEIYAAETENEHALFSYEYWNGRDWVKLTGEADAFIDGTFGFKQSGSVSFKIPDTIATVSVNNEEHLYIRIRLVTKDFALGGVYVQDDKGLYQWRFNGNVQSPILDKIRITYDAPAQQPEYAVADSNFKWIDLDSLFEQAEKERALSVFDIDEEQCPSLYLGFSAQITAGEFPLYFNIENGSSVKKSNPAIGDGLSLPAYSPRGNKRLVSIEWEYWSDTGWKKLSCSDFTDSFHESGFIICTIPEDMAACRLYDTECFWLRAVKMNGSFEITPVIEDIVINSVYAVNADSYTDEIIGSGTGAPGQVFRTAHQNLLPGLRLCVDEGSIPSANEIAKMKKDGIEQPYETADTHVWVRYKEVPNFYTSDAFSRHFVINYSTGEILFGDGVHGVMPPKGKFNIKVSEYKVGGGKDGNVAAHTLQFLTQSIPYIAGCDNPFAAEGGSDMETVESLKARSAGVFKSLNRAVTKEDFEWISREASSSVGRAHCLKNKTAAGKIKTVIIPEMTNSVSYTAKLFPSKELLRRVKQYLEERKLVGTEIEVSGPVYRSCRITLEVVFKNMVFDSDGEKAKIRRQLEIYFHPLLGGSGQGFEFGKSVTKGLILQTLEKNQAIVSVPAVGIFDEDAGVMVETLVSQEDELPYVSHIDITDRRE